MLKNDMDEVGEWIKHLDEHKEDHSEMLQHLDSRLVMVEKFMDELKENTDDVQEISLSKQLSKQP